MILVNFRVHAKDLRERGFVIDSVGGNELIDRDFGHD
jgi:hypothetical protein